MREELEQGIGPDEGPEDGDNEDPDADWETMQDEGRWPAWL